MAGRPPSATALQRTAPARRSEGPLYETLAPIGSEGGTFPLFVPALIPLHIRGLTFQAARTLTVVALFAGWLAALGYFWFWFFQPGHERSLAGMVVLATVQVYLTTLPLPLFLTSLAVRRVNPRLPLPSLRVAFVVTKAPSEPWEVAEATLVAMLAQSCSFPYDVWLCDEDPSETTMAWCEKHGVSVSTRRGVEEYHRPVWPRRTKCKEGNLAYFYDHWGYEDYDVVAQFDVDHVPSPGYLTHALRPFSDPSIGYVAAPSICDSNAGESWSARGRLYTESAFHGSVQAGSNEGFGPCCIGSHYVCRTQALREIGGIGPELAEDFTTSFLMNAAGWRGAFAVDAEAHGEGPPTFGAMVTQEYQWSRSMTGLALGLLSANWHKLDWRLRIKYTYQVGYYPVLAFFSVLALGLSPFASLTGTALLHTNYLSYVSAVLLLAVAPLLLKAKLRRLGVLRPTRPRLLSWEQTMYSLTRWPFVVRGVLAAIAEKVLHRQSTIRVTPKGSVGISRLPLALVAPYASIVVVMAGAEELGVRRPASQGYAFLCLFIGMMYAIVAVLIPVLHGWEAKRAGPVAIADVFVSIRTGLLASLAAATVLVVAAFTTFGDFHLLHAPWFV